MLTYLTIFMMLAVGYAYFREGLFTAFTMLCNVMFAGLLAFNFWEPLANLLDGPLQGSALEGHEDFLVLLVIFCLTLGLLRLVTNNLANNLVDYTAVPQQIGGAFVGILTGYLAAGFFISALQTLPWHDQFLGFEAKAQSESPLRRVFPPDRVWLAMMRRAGAYPLANQEDPDVPEGDDDIDEYDKYLTFDKYGTFELRYKRYRRYGDTHNPLKYQGELDRELHHPLP
jgi:hypothetical protein